MKEAFEANIVMNSKKLFIGDICYALKEDIYRNIWSKEMNYESGVIEFNNEAVSVVGHTFAGDGDFYDNQQNEFSVDAGVIGVTNLKYSKRDEADLKDLGVVVDIPSEKAYVEFEDNNGLFNITITDVMTNKIIYSDSIGTAPVNEEAEDDWYEEDEGEYEESMKNTRSKIQESLPVEARHAYRKWKKDFEANSAKERDNRINQHKESNYKKYIGKINDILSSIISNKYGAELLCDIICKKADSDDYEIALGKWVFGGSVVEFVMDFSLNEDYDFFTHTAEDNFQYILHSVPLYITLSSENLQFVDDSEYWYDYRMGLSKMGWSQLADCANKGLIRDAWLWEDSIGMNLYLDVLADPDKVEKLYNALEEAVEIEKERSQNRKESKMRESKSDEEYPINFENGAVEYELTSLLFNRHGKEIGVGASAYCVSLSEMFEYLNNLYKTSLNFKDWDVVKTHEFSPTYACEGIYRGEYIIVEIEIRKIIYPTY